MMVVVGNDGADDSAYDQCADPVAAVHAAMIVMVMAGRWRRRMVMLYCNRTAVVDGTASVHHRMGFVMGTVSMSSGAVMDGTAFMTHRLAFSRAGALMDCTAFVLRCALVDSLPLTVGRALMNGRALMAGAFLHRAALLSVCALLHMRSGLMSGAAFLYRPDLLCMCRPLTAGVTGRRGFGNSHDERGAEETCHQCDCQYFL